MKTIYVCGKCGKRAEYGADTQRWLIARRKGSDALIVRCEKCVTKHALRIAERDKKRGLK
jgi:hypothetical protein